MSVIKPSRCRYKLMQYKLHWKPHSNSKYFQARVLTSAQATFAFNLLSSSSSWNASSSAVKLCRGTPLTSASPSPLQECQNAALFPVASENKSDWLGSNAGQMHLLRSLIWSFGQSQRTTFSCQDVFLFFFCVRAEELNPQLSNGRKKQIKPKAVEDFTVESMKQLGPLSSLSFFRSRFICEVMSGCNSRVPRHTHDSFRLWVSFLLSFFPFYLNWPTSHASTGYDGTLQWEV